MSHSPRSPAFFPISSAASPSPIANIDISDTDEPMIMPHDVALNVDESDLIDVTIDEQTTFPSQIPVSPHQHQHVKHEAAVPEKEPDSTIDNKIDKDASHSIISPPATAPSSTRAQFPLPLPLPPPPKHIAHHTASASPTNGTISHPAPLPIRMQLPLRLGNKTGTIAQTKPIIPHPISILPASKPMDDMDETDLRVDDISHTTSSSSVPRVSSCIPIRVGSRMVNPYILLCIFVAGQASNTIMWLTFPSLPRESKGAFDLTDFELTLFLNWGAILPLLLMVPFSTLISRRDGLKRALRAAAFFLFFGASIRSIPLFFSTEYLHGHKDLVLFLLQAGSILNAFALPIFLASPSLIGQQFFPVHVRAVVSSMAATSNQLGNTIAFLFPYVCSSVSGLYRLCWIQWGMSALIAFALYVYFPPDEITYPHSDTADVTHPSTPSRIRTHHTREMDESQEIPLTLMETEPPSDAGEVEEMNDESHIPATHDISTTSIDPEIVVPSTHLISRDSIISNTSQNSSQPTPRPRRSSLIPMQRTSLVQLMSAPNVNANNDAVVTVPAARADASWLSRTGATLWLWWHALRSMKNPSFFACLVACGLGNGVWSGWMPHIPLVFENVLSEEESGTLSAAAYFSGVLGGLMSGPITEKCFPNKHKAFASILLTLSLFGFMWLTLCAPSPFGKALITSSSLSLYGMLSFPIILVGLAQGALVPLSYELCADLSYGVLHEGVSGGVYQLVDNAFNSCFLFIAPMAFVTNTHATNLIGIIAFLLSLIALVPVNPSYQRLHDREGETDPNGDGAETGDGQVGEGHVMHKDADSAAFYRQGRL